MCVSTLLCSRVLMVLKLALVTVLLSGQVLAEVRTEAVEYAVDGEPFRGLIAFDPDLPGPRPAVMVVHEWWGYNDYARNQAIRLAELGYVAFAIDMYGAGRIADTPDQAQSLMNSVLSDAKVLESRFEIALQLLRGHPRVDRDRIAALGYCFGGGVVLHMARKGLDLAGVVSMHGTLSSQISAAPGGIKAPLRIYGGGDDPFVPSAQVIDFVQEMLTAGARFDLVNFPAARHAFTNPAATDLGLRFGMPLAYDIAADRESWAGLRAFLAKVFGEDAVP